MHRSEHDPDLHAIALEAMAQILVDQWATDPFKSGEAGMCLLVIVIADLFGLMDLDDE